MLLNSITALADVLGSCRKSIHQIQVLTCHEHKQSATVRLVCFVARCYNELSHAHAASIQELSPCPLPRPSPPNPTCLTTPPLPLSPSSSPSPPLALALALVLAPALALALAPALYLLQRACSPLRAQHHHASGATMQDCGGREGATADSAS